MARSQDKRAAATISVRGRVKKVCRSEATRAPAAQALDAAAAVDGLGVALERSPHQRRYGANAPSSATVPTLGKGKRSAKPSILDLTRAAHCQTHARGAEGA